ncbi:hypothetical protein PR202_gb07779 [Eleusine coracana subsp. coracana]|uniref:BTB domain-containing protein n=1 Tax=Eleusine coracana subsp. coracana TaxID=191504 RepID=A0AAV5ED32_ELECO|nr:hypothetical protein PR202_gb07779 [Eleusine coracana subsp. coracana]
MFSTKLYDTMKDGAANTAIVEIDHKTADMFGNLLHFIYIDSFLPEMTSTTEFEKHDEAANSTAQHLLVVADRYGMERLKLICEDKLCRHISLNTVGTTLVLAEQHHYKRLKHACFKFIKTQKKLDVVVATDGFQHLAKSFPFALFELIAKLGEVELQKPSHIDTKLACKFFTNKQNSWGMYQFIKLEDLEQQHLKDDCFTVRCDIIVLGAARVADIAVHAPPVAAFMPPPPDWP